MAWRPRLRGAAPAVALALAAALVLAALPAAAVVPAVPATPPAHVVDLANVIDDGQEAQLDAVLRDLEARTTAQVLVLTVRSLEGEAIEAFSIDVAHNRWKLGQRGKDNGVLVTLSIEDRRYRIEVGYGLEAVLPDSLVGSLGRELLVPAFRAGDYGGGLVALSGALAQRVAEASGISLTGVPSGGRARGASRQQGRPGPLATALGLVLMLVVFAFLVRHPQLLIWMLLTSRGGGGGSWGGGGGGGFGGGGGGGFGGGGASGSW